MLRPTRYDGEHVGMMITAQDVYIALDSPYARSRPAYTKAVLTSYIQIKLARGKTRQEVAIKLETIERNLPWFQREFYAVRAEQSLPPSRVFPRLPPQAQQRLSAQTSAHPFTRRVTVSGAGARTHASATGADTPRPAVPAARNDEDTDEPPPPPYASQDPDPDSTRLLQERLAAEAEANGQSPMSLVSPVPAAQPVLPPDSPAEGTYAPPSGPPPRRQSPPRIVTPPHTAPAGPSRAAASASPSPRRRSPSPPAEPQTAEEREALEQSLLDEAIRASVASERERAEFEAAVQLSVAEAEREQVQQSAAGPSRPATAEETRVRASAASAQRIEHRRTVSEAHLSPPEYAYGVSSVDPHLANLLDGVDLSDNEDAHSRAHPPQPSVVMPTPQPYLPPSPVTPERSSNARRWKSNNPFLSAEEREAEHEPEHAHEPAGGQPHPDLLGVDLLGDELPASTPMSPSSSAQARPSAPPSPHARDGPGSGYTLASYSTAPDGPPPPLPPKPDGYAPPPGPPPGRGASGAGAAPPPLPARPRSMGGAA
ncbi:hypothetical protein Q5752_000766 [Cryptotrichosporon argae]